MEKLKVKASSANNVSNSNSLKVSKNGTDDKKKPANGEKSSNVDMAKVKEDWNKYLEYLEEKGVKGKDELDKEGLGNKYFLEYIKNNKGTSLSVDIIPKIRKEYMSLRESNIESMKKKEGSFNYQGKSISGPNEDYSNFMKYIVDNEKSKDPNYVGKNLTRTPFPGLETAEGAKVKTYSKEQAQKFTEQSKQERSKVEAERNKKASQLGVKL